MSRAGSEEAAGGEDDVIIGLKREETFEIASNEGRSVPFTCSQAPGQCNKTSKMNKTDVA